MLYSPAYRIGTVYRSGLCYCFRHRNVFRQGDRLGYQCVLQNLVNPAHWDDF